MSLEGTIRDLGLHDVSQLLSLSRKTGTLVVSSRLRGRRAWMRFGEGAVVDAGDGAPPAPDQATSAAANGDHLAIQEMTLQVLAWREGEFAFRAHEVSATPVSRVQLPTDALLVQSARREDEWNRLRTLVPSAEAVPAFLESEPDSSAMIRLAPDEWEVLTHVDGSRDVRALAARLGRDVISVAGAVYALVQGGLLTIRDGRSPDRAAPSGSMAIIAAERNAERYAHRKTERHAVTLPASAGVASGPLEPSSDERFPIASVADRATPADLRDAGDDAARSGDFGTALSCWGRALRSPEVLEDANRIRQAIELTTRLQALLQPIGDH